MRTMHQGTETSPSLGLPNSDLEAGLWVNGEQGQHAGVYMVVHVAVVKQMPGLSGAISATFMLAGSSSTMSVRISFQRRVWPCQ